MKTLPAARTARKRRSPSHSCLVCSVEEFPLSLSFGSLVVQNQMKNANTTQQLKTLHHPSDRPTVSGRGRRCGGRKSKKKNSFLSHGNRRNAAELAEADQGVPEPPAHTTSSDGETRQIRHDITTSSRQRRRIMESLLPHFQLVSNGKTSKFSSITTDCFLTTMSTKTMH